LSIPDFIVERNS